MTCWSLLTITVPVTVPSLGKEGYRDCRDKRRYNECIKAPDETRHTTRDTSKWIEHGASPKPGPCGAEVKVCVAQVVTIIRLSSSIMDLSRSSTYATELAST
ncbi:hypothetical protein F4782DRAFT_497063 [Xylaria castorea]|nr:hypothetical protein F4782DRAFT_497063 [Xylaria castorea]